MKLHTYFFKFNYDAPNSVTGVYTRHWTGMFSVEAENREIANNNLTQAISAKYPYADNIRNIRNRN